MTNNSLPGLGIDQEGLGQIKSGSRPETCSETCCQIVWLCLKHFPTHFPFSCVMQYPSSTPNNSKSIDI
ncbi:hypothetical protein MJO28_006892 [Puccinia striiformis f. sp. tritici]|uniref:Uncharacterized protein n=1 Tax=Puccinia striiformis f. sp. tritici TaxID=168172 RepID=A0ACC0EE41_9BASI|nr:hypothetical protein MJO28_006892 [Puccinia striiformis f. sp. tritici]KAI7955463.1 hypothetical protein MJO29_006862 [Puccinia striiformis f. sp. tritici]